MNFNLLAGAADFTQRRFPEALQYDWRLKPEVQPRAVGQRRVV